MERAIAKQSSPDRRPAVAVVRPRRPPVAAVTTSSAQLLQQRLGNQGTQALVARSLPALPGATGTAQVNSSIGAKPLAPSTPPPTTESLVIPLTSARTEAPAASRPGVAVTVSRAAPQSLSPAPEGQLSDRKPGTRAEMRVSGSGAAGPGSTKPAAAGAGVEVGTKVDSVPHTRTAIAPAIAAVHDRAARARKHSAPGVAVASAQAASISPQTEQKRAAATLTVASLDAARTEEVKRNEFKSKLKQAIEAATPKPTTESEADKVIKTGAAQASGSLRAQLTTERDSAAGPMKSAANNDVPASSQPAPPTASLQSEPVGAPPAPVSASPVVPPPLPTERLDYSADRGPSDQVMAESNVSKEELHVANEPAFGPALAARSLAEKHEATAEAKYRLGESRVQDQAQAAATQTLSKDLAGMHAAREQQIGKVVSRQLGTRGKDAQERQRITETISAIKDKARADVEAILGSMEAEAGTIFESGLKRAEKAYEDTFEEAKGGIGTWLATWGSDWEKLIEKSLAKARTEYLRHVDLAIDEVATFVDAKLKAAKERVAGGRKEVDNFVKGLDASVKQFGEEAVQAVSTDFETLGSTIDQRRDGLIDKLSQQYKTSHERMSAMEGKLREENKSLWQRVYDATVGLGRKITAFKDMLVGILGKAAGVVLDIIAHPIRFLGNLVSGIMQGLKNFMAKIGIYLQKGLMEWLFGALGSAGLQLPDKFDLQGIISIVLQILGLTYANFRARAVAIVGEPVVAALEKSASIFKIVITEGIPGLWRFVKEQLADLKSMVLDAILDFVRERVIMAGITWIIGLLNPASAFFKACKAIYDIVLFFINRASQIAALVTAIVDSVAAIAKGALGTAIGLVEGALAKTIPVTIGFLASLLGLGDPSKPVRGFIEKARAPVNKAIDWAISLAVKGVKAVGKLTKGTSEHPDDEKAQLRGEHPVQLEAKKAIATRVGTEHTRDQAVAIAAQIEADLKPSGLRRLEIGKESEEGVSVIYAEASPKLPLGQLLREVPRPSGRSVTSKVQLTLETPVDVGATELTPADPARSTVPIGGIAWTPSTRASRTVNVVTWNTSNVDPPGNTSHAEHQFVKYLEKRPDFHSRVEGITIVNVSRSPCSTCGPELARLLSQIKKARAGRPVTAQIYWTKLHETGAQPTSWQTLHEMQKEGWTLHAPAEALPPEKTVHTDLVKVHPL